MMRQLASARWETLVSGFVALTCDWAGPGLPPLTLNAPARMVSLERADARTWALRSGHWWADDSLHFFFWKALCPEVAAGAVRVAGPFNDWGHSLNMERWVLRPVCVLGAEGFELSVPAAQVFGAGDTLEFKFLREDGRWLEPPHDADNITRDEGGHRNLVASLQRTGRHLFRFQATDIDPTAAPVRMIFETAALLELGDILASDPLDVLEPPGHFGASIEPTGTHFRVFAPRAEKVSVTWSRGAAHGRCDLKPAGQGVWSGVVALDLTEAHYLLEIDGRTTFDPWARRLEHTATDVIGVVCGPAELVPFDDGFRPPVVEDLVILETHIRDLLGLAHQAGSVGFRELAEWIRRDGTYLRHLGVNALEFLPCTDYECGPPEEYHWGYMPITAFSPAMAYAWGELGAGRSTAEFQDLVRSCHEAGFAVIMDLVLNHFGAPNALQVIDEGYYYRTDSQGVLSNWSGCGNDVRAEAPMFKRLVLAGLRHWTEVLGVDGVRLDLAELLGTPLLREIEADYRLRAPHKILIAEPWSFRGHIARDLDDSTWTSWDDAFREFLPAYVRGRAKAADLLHHLAACGIRPAARLRYAQSHDDWAWLDRITERPESDALHPTSADILRTRMMHSILLLSAGVPMLSAGQDFLMTKRGVGNTWQRGDLNRLEPARLERFRSEHEFVAQLVHFRLSARGAPLRPRQAVSAGWMEVTHQADGEAFVAVLNADGLMGPTRILFACNPHAGEVALRLPQRGPWAPVVLSPHPACPHAPGASPWLDADQVSLPPLACGVWFVEG